MFMTNDPEEKDEPTPVIEGAPTKVTKKRGKDDEDEDEERVYRRKIPRVLTYDEMDRLLLVVDDIEDLVAIRLMLFAGLRVAEASALRVQDIHPESMSVFVKQGKMGKDRYSPIDIASIAFARSYAHCADLKPDDPLFNYTKRTLQRRVEEYYGKAEITEAGCHTLRHTCATWQLDMGIPLDVVKNNLGHESIEMTQKYLHLNIRQRSRIFKDCTRFGI